MTADEALAGRLAAIALAHRAALPLEKLLAECVPVAALRDLARRLAVSPKGFRVERASAAALASALVRDLVPEHVEQACAVLAEQLAGSGAPPPAAAAPVPPPPPAADGRVARLRDAVRDRDGQIAGLRQRLLDRERDLLRELERERETVARLRGAVDALERQRGAAAAPGPGADRDRERQLHELLRQRETWQAAEDEYLRRLARQNTLLQEMRERVAELEQLVPPGRKRRKPPPPPPPPDERFRLPHFTSEFHRSIEGMDRRSVGRAVEAVLRFATEGHSYPGLEVKQLEGSDLWSMRAGIKVRVYFRPRPDGDFDVIAAGDREDQHTFLRRSR